VHLTESDFKILFGNEATLTVKKNLSQPGQYACEERVSIVGPKKEISGVSILGPFRSASQVELSATDARSIGLPIVIKESGDLRGTPGCKIVGPKGSLELQEGVIVAKRHIHATSEDAKKLGVKDKDIVSVKINTPERSLIFGDVVVRVSDSYALAMHIDTDEANASGMVLGVMGEIVKL
jgi:putative phosphotransacetylase